MIIKIKFKLSEKNQILPLNYQYPISSWIYKVLEKADSTFSQILHEHGYRTEKGKTFKFFTFSKLRFPKNTWKIIPNTDRMEINASNAYLRISFLLPKQIENFVIGLFKEQTTFIGDKISGINMKVESIETLKPILKNKTDNKDYITARLKTVSPLVLGINIEDQKNEQYFEPTHPQYKKIFLNNLIDKYKTGTGKQINIDNLNFTLTKLYKNKKGKPKTELQTIKAFTSAETKIKGYYYEFELSAPADFIEIGLSAGFGSMNALGFGFCEIVSES